MTELLASLEGKAFYLLQFGKCSSTFPESACIIEYAMHEFNRINAIQRWFNVFDLCSNEVFILQHIVLFLKKLRFRWMYFQFFLNKQLKPH